MTTDTGTAIANYGQWDDEAAEKDAAAAKSSGSGKWMKLVEGRNVVRVLPPRKGQRSPFFTVHEHYIETPGGSAVSFACPRKMGGGNCTVCNFAEQLNKSPNKVDRDRAYSLWPRMRVYMNVVDRIAEEAAFDDDKDLPDILLDSLRILAVGRTIYDDMTKIRLDATDGGNFTDPGGAGFDIVINRTGKTKNDTEYMLLASRKTRPLSSDPELVAMYLEGMAVLEGCLKRAEDLDEDEIAAIEDALGIHEKRRPSQRDARPDPRAARADQGQSQRGSGRDVGGRSTASNRTVDVPPEPQRQQPPRRAPSRTVADDAEDDVPR